MGTTSGDKTQTVPKNIDWTKYGRSGTDSSGNPNYTNEYQFFSPNQIGGQTQVVKDPQTYTPTGDPKPNGDTTSYDGQTALPTSSLYDVNAIMKARPDLIKNWDYIHDPKANGNEGTGHSFAEDQNYWSGDKTFYDFIGDWGNKFGKDSGVNTTDWYLPQSTQPQAGSQGGLSGFAAGGMPLVNSVESPGSHVGARGFLGSPSPGRADTITTRVRRGSYIMPADAVSGLGQGNSLHGAHMLDSMVNHYKAPHIPGAKYVPGMPGSHYEDGGLAGHHMMDVHLSGGEYSIEPEVVRAIGDGDPDRGAEMLDHLVHTIRDRVKHHIDTTPPPK